MKKALSLIIALIICFSTCICTYSAKETNEKDVFSYIVGGNGTKDCPYILSSECPYFDETEVVVKEVIQPTIQPLVDFSGTLTDKSFPNAKNGGVYRYKGGGPDASVDNALLILGISYVNNEDTQVLASSIGDTSTRNIFFSRQSKYYRWSNCKSSVRKKVGILQISYQISCHGSWFYYSCLDVWHSDPTARVPSKSYGGGSFLYK